MSLARILYVIGVIFMVWAVISGINVVYKMSESEETFTSGYSFKLGLFILGLLLAYLGRKYKQKA